MKSHDVRFWAIRRNKTAKGASYTVRWTVAGREKSHTLAGRARAVRYKARLLQAADKGEAFDVESCRGLWLSANPHSSPRAFVPMHHTMTVAALPEPVSLTPIRPEAEGEAA